MDGIIRKKSLILLGQLSGQSFIMSDDQSRLIDRRDDIGPSKSFARTGHAQEGLETVTSLETSHQFLNRLGLVAGGLEWRN